MRRQFPRAERPFYEIKAAARPDGEPAATDIWIYDVIGDDWFDSSLTAKELCQTIAAIETDEIVVHLNSPGGSVTDGMAIYNSLITHPAKVTSIVEGWTGSIATVVALAAERVSMFDNVMWMIHNPWTICIGDGNALRDMATELDRVGAFMSRVYMQRCTKTEEQLQTALDAETYLEADQAAEWGFVDEVIPAKVAVAACDAGVLQALGFNPDPHYRGREPLAIGRTISAENEGKLRTARDQLDEVLATLDARASDPAPSGSGDAPRTMDSKALAAIKLASPRH